LNFNLKSPRKLCRKNLSKIRKIIAQKILFPFLKFRVRRILKKSKTRVFAITGSVGKTTAKNAAAEVLKSTGVEFSPRSFNTPFGIFFTIFGIEKAPRSFFEIINFVRQIFAPRKLPPNLILEFGADRPGDLKTLLQIVKPDFAALTTIVAAHLGKKNFQNEAEIFREKVQLLQNAKRRALCNFKVFEKFSDENHAPKFSFFGENEKCDFCVSNLKNERDGFSFVLEIEKSRQNFFIPILGKFHSTAILPAIFFGVCAGISLPKIAAILRNFRAGAGRGAIFKIGKLQVCDQSFNASFAAMRANLEIFAKFSAPRKIAILGEMREVGGFSEKFHREIAAIATTNFDFVFLVGEDFRKFANHENARFFETLQSLENFLKNFLRAADFIFIKGSHSNNLEKVVEFLRREF